MSNTEIIISARHAYITDALKASGFTVYRPYRDKTLFGRVLREVWFRLRLPEKVWYSKKCLVETPKKVILHDPLITKHYIEWIQNNFPKANIQYEYNNMVGRAKHIMPSEIPFGVVVTTFDENDSKKYKIKLKKEGEYPFCYIGKKKAIKYDVVFVGADKGRGEYLLNLREQMEELGLKTKFIITADGRFSKQKKYYSKRIPYSKIIEYDNESKAILNIIMPRQKGATLRDFESIFNRVKLITTNSNIKKYDFYKEENVFILGERELKELPEFLNLPFETLSEDILNKHLMRLEK